MENLNKRIIITEGNFDKEFLEKVLPSDLIAESKFFIGQGYSSLISKAKSIALHSDLPIYLIMDSDTTNSFEINERKENIQSIFIMLGKSEQVKMFFFVPELESVFFQDEYFRNKYLNNILNYELNNIISPSQIIKSKFNRVQLLEKIGKTEVENLRQNSSVMDLIKLMKD